MRKYNIPFFTLKPFFIIATLLGRFLDSLMNRSPGLNRFAIQSESFEQLTHTLNRVASLQETDNKKRPGRSGYLPKIN